MKIVVIGGSGLIGSKVVACLREEDEKASPHRPTRAWSNLLAAEVDARVRHHVALSVFGTERLTESGYIRAKIAQEKLIAESAIPYSIVHATQVCEFVTDEATDGDTVRVPPALIQPIAADDPTAPAATTALAVATSQAFGNRRGAPGRCSDRSRSHRLWRSVVCEVAMSRLYGFCGDAWPSLNAADAIRRPG